MPREWQLGVQREDPDAVVRLWAGGREQEGALGEIRPARDRAHLFIAQAVGLGDDCDWVSGEGSVTEDVDLAKWLQHGLILDKLQAQTTQTPLNLRSLRLFPTTESEEKTIAAPASMGLSSPSAASGMAAML